MSPATLMFPPTAPVPAPDSLRAELEHLAAALRETARHLAAAGGSEVLRAMLLTTADMIAADGQPPGRPG